MQTIFLPVSNPSSLLASNRTSAQHRDPRRSILCASNRRNRFGVGKTGRLVLQSACIIASKLGFLPEPLGLALREFGAGNGGGSGPWKGFGWNGFDGWKRRRRAKSGVVAILVICAVGLLAGKDLSVDGNALFGGLGLILFGVSAQGWRRGARDWILGFCCCAFLVGLAFKNQHSRRLLGFFERLKKKVRRRRVF